MDTSGPFVLLLVNFVADIVDSFVACRPADHSVTRPLSDLEPHPVVNAHHHQLRSLSPWGFQYIQKLVDQVISANPSVVVYEDYLSVRGELVPRSTGPVRVALDNVVLKYKDNKDIGVHVRLLIEEDAEKVIEFSIEVKGGNLHLDCPAVNWD